MLSWSLKWVFICMSCKSSIRIDFLLFTMVNVNVNWLLIICNLKKFTLITFIYIDLLEIIIVAYQISICINNITFRCLCIIHHIFFRILSTFLHSFQNWLLILLMLHIVILIKPAIINLYHLLLLLFLFVLLLVILRRAI